MKLTEAEQKNVRAALRFLRVKCGTWKNVAKALKLGECTPGNIAGGLLSASAETAYRVAKFAGVGVDDVLNGAFPPAGVCPHCGNVSAVTAPPTENSRR